MKNKHVLLPIAILLCLLCSVHIRAQVGIGSNLAPEKAALLQLRERIPGNAAMDNSNAYKGMGLPRVALVDGATLEPLIDPASSDYETQKLLHQGLMVYNLTDNPSKGLAPGIYVWDGSSFWTGIDVIGGEDLRLTTTPANEMIFPSGLTFQALAMQTLDIDWRPKAITAQIELIHTLNGGLKWTLPQTNTGTAGLYRLNIQPEPFTQAEINANPFLPKESNLSIIAYDMSGTSLRQDVTLRQIHFAAYVKGFQSYMDMGRTYTINIATNAAWEATIIDLDQALESTSLPATGGAISEEGTDYTFKLKSDANKEGKIVRVKITSPNGLFADQEFVINTTQIYPNSYFITPGATLDIPIRKAYAMWANDVGTPIPASGVVTAELVWQDQQNMVPTLGLLNGDEGINSKIRVRTNSGIEGNALVAVKVDGDIRWTWHLWITNYNPDSAAPNIPGDAHASTPVTGGNTYTCFNGVFSTVFMDRNLGATSVVPGNPKILGHYYQWGKKDPILPAALTNSTLFGERPIYGIDNVQLTKGSTGQILAQVPNDETTNLANSIKNPLTYFVPSPTNDADWYSARTGTHNTTLWLQADGLKGNYDPCPTGWRIPVGGPGKLSPVYGYPLPAISNNSYNYTSEGIGNLPAQGVVENNDFNSNSTIGAYYHLVGYDSDFLAPGYDAGAGGTAITWRLLTRGAGKPVRCVKEL